MILEILKTDHSNEIHLNLANLLKEHFDVFETSFRGASGSKWISQSSLLLIKEKGNNNEQWL